MDKQDLLEIALNDPRTKGDRQKAIDWLDKAEIIELPGGVVILYGNRVHIETDGTNKTGFIRMLKETLKNILVTREYITADIRKENKVVIKIAKWLGFAVTNENDGMIFLRKDKP